MKIIKNKLKNIIAAAACLTTLLGPALSIQDKYDAKPAQAITQSATNERDALSFPNIQLKKNTAKASTGTVDNLEGRLAVLGFDILFNGLKSGIGAKSNGDDFWPAFGKGALAGMIVYGGKEIASYNGYVPFAGAMGKIFHDLGVSMSDNVAFSRPILSRYVTDFGPVEFDINIDKAELDLYFHPYPVFAIVENIAKGHRFEIKESFYNLTPVFSFEKPYVIREGWRALGMVQQNVFNYCRTSGKDDVKIFKSHEMNHVLFTSEFRFLDELMGKKSEVVEQMPIIWPLAPVFDYIKFGPFLAERFFLIPQAIHQDAYWYTPFELEAYTMERPTYPNSHPFYKQ